MRMAGLIHTLVWTKFGFEHPNCELLLQSQHGGNGEKVTTNQDIPTPTPMPRHPTSTQADQWYKKNWATSAVKGNSTHFQSWRHTTPKQQCCHISDSNVPVRDEDNLCFQNRELINHHNVVMGGGEWVTQMLWRMKPRLLLSVPNTSTVVNQLSWFPGMEAASVRSCHPCEKLLQAQISEFHWTLPV